MAGLGGIRSPFRDPDDDGDFCAADWVDEINDDGFTDEEVAEHADALVELGAQRLDETHPGWAEWIDVDTLDISDVCKCVVGQVYAHLRPDDPMLWPYNAVFVLLDEEPDQAGPVLVTEIDDIVTAEGFSEPSWTNSELPEVGYGDLLEAWKRAIEARSDASG